jgi:hypothetical protein
MRRSRSIRYCGSLQTLFCLSAAAGTCLFPLGSPAALGCCTACPFRPADCLNLTDGTQMRGLPCPYVLSVRF